MVKYSAETKERVQLDRDRMERQAGSIPWVIAAAVGLAVLVIVMVVVRGGLTMILIAISLLALAVSMVLLAWARRPYPGQPMPDGAITVHGDSIWLVGQYTTAGRVQRGDETWPLSETSVATGTQWGSHPVLVFTAPGRKPRRFLVRALDQPADEILAQVGLRKDVLPR